MYHCDTIKQVPDLPFSNKVKYDRHLCCLPHFICCPLFPGCVLKGKINVISLYILVLNALRWLRNPRISPSLQKELKAPGSAGAPLCMANVQSITLSLIIHVTTSRTARALFPTPPDHYGATELKEWSTLICSEEGYGDIFQLLLSSATPPPPPPPHPPYSTPLCSPPPHSPWWETLNSRLEAVILGGPAGRGAERDE